MRGKIYLIQDDDTLRALTEQSYPNEDQLQTLLAKYPDLLAGDQMNPVAPRRWLLVAREVGIPGEEGGLDQWSLDHLFLDQEGIPTLVEVKRSRDTRMRREVVGQMLDYASNAVVYWPVETIRAKFEATCQSRNANPDQLVAELIETNPEDDAAISAFWGQVKTNLQAAKIRLVFVSDEIPPELRRIVEFLNEHMDPVEVLAVEVRQYVGQKLKTLVPRVIGQTAEAQGKKAGGGREARQWDEQSFFQELEAKQGTDSAAVAKRILEWAEARKLRIWWGKGKKVGSCFPMLDHNDKAHWLISFWTHGLFDIPLARMKKRPPFDSEAKRLELLRKVNKIPGISFSEDAIDGYPSMSLREFTAEEKLNQLLNILDWAIDEILRPQGTASQPPLSQTGHELSNQHSHSDKGA